MLRNGRLVNGLSRGERESTFALFFGVLDSVEFGVLMVIDTGAVCVDFAKGLLSRGV